MSLGLKAVYEVVWSVAATCISTDPTGKRSKLGITTRNKDHGMHFFEGEELQINNERNKKNA